MIHRSRFMPPRRSQLTARLLLSSCGMLLAAGCTDDQPQALERRDAAFEDAAADSPRTTNDEAGRGDLDGDGRSDAGAEVAGPPGDARTDLSSGDSGPKIYGIAAPPSNTTCRPPEDPELPPVRLSLTGCVDQRDPRRPAPGLIPYTIASPLWSDAAEKTRFIALPEGSTIGVKDCRVTPASCGPLSAGGTPESDGKLDVPVNTVLVKNFLFGGKFVETRLFIRIEATRWVGYSYAWRADESDADLAEDVFGGTTKTIRNAFGEEQDWTFPSREMCLQCHTEAAGFSLGIELRQLNIDFTYPSGVTSNQLDTLEHIGVFSRRLLRPLPAPYVSPTGQAGTEAERARSYLHANCSNCHRPRGTFDALDLRHDTAFADMRLCNHVPERGTLGIADALRLVPMRPDLSLLAVRMRRLDFARMPPIGSRIIDLPGVHAIETWISSIGDCP